MICPHCHKEFTDPMEILREYMTLDEEDKAYIRKLVAFLLDRKRREDGVE